MESARERAAGIGEDLDLVAGGLEDRASHVSEERAVVDEDETLGQRRRRHLLRFSQSSKAIGR